MFASFQDYVSGLQILISNVIDHIKGLEVTLTALKLEELSIEDNLLSQVRNSRCSVGLAIIPLIRAGQRRKSGWFGPLCGRAPSTGCHFSTTNPASEWLPFILSVREKVKGNLSKRLVKHASCL